jgi:hypothetical protein
MQCIIAIELSWLASPDHSGGEMIARGRSQITSDDGEVSLAITRVLFFGRDFRPISRERKHHESARSAAR